MVKYNRTQTPCLSSVAGVVFLLRVCVFYLGEVTCVAVSVKYMYVLLGHKCRVKGHLCLFIAQTPSSLHDVNVCTAFHLVVFF